MFTKINDPVVFMILVFLFIMFFASGCMTEQPDRIFTNGVIWTGNSSTPNAEAIAVRGSDILAVGTSREIEALAGQSTEIVDLEGSFVVPGFIDNHTHFLQGGFQLASVDLRDADSPEEFALRILAFAGQTQPGRWITGGDWDHEAWGGQLPEKSWIDESTPDNPLFVSRLDGHMALANSVALELAGVTRDTPDPDGGTIVRDPETGDPTGVLKDEAMSLVYAAMPDPSTEELAEALDRAMEHAVSLGVTQVHDMGSFGGWMDLEAYRAAQADRDLKIRIYSFVPLSTRERLSEFISENGEVDEWLRWGGLKGFVDGSLGSTTAWFYDPYEDEPETAGLLVTDTTSIREDVLAADAAGLHLGIHAIGDRAIDWLLGVFSEANKQNGERDRRFRIEHSQHLSPDAFRRYQDLGIIASAQPYHAIDDGRWAVKRIGPERIKRTYAFRSFLNAGVRLTFGSDWTVAPISPMKGIYAAVTRQTIDGANPLGWVPEEKISVEEALTAYTASNAYAGFMEDRAGSIAAGKLADFVVLSENLLEIDPEAISRVRIRRTVIAGEDRFVADSGRESPDKLSGDVDQPGEKRDSLHLER